MARKLDFSGNHPGKSKIRRNKLGIYPIKTFYYGHIQHEKKLPDGSFFRAEHYYQFTAVLFLRRVDYKKKEYMVGTILHTLY